MLLQIELVRCWSRGYAYLFGAFDVTAILLTGGTGYIGSHACVAAIEAGYLPIIVDNLSNSSVKVISRIEQITGICPLFFEGDLLDDSLLNTIFDTNKITAVMHFAGLKAVAESVKQPLQYYYNNLSGSLSLLQAMKRAGVRNLVFSSSAAVYGDPSSNPITEDFPRGATNPYGQSKLMVENVLADLHTADEGWNIACLRYFNPAGAHKSGLMGEAPRGIASNLIPTIGKVALGGREKLSVFGNNYPTFDGTGVRDYIHVVDLAEGHMAALDYLSKRNSGLLNVNLGRGEGVSVLEIVTAFERASGKRVPLALAKRREGDIAECWADPSVANRLLQWSANRHLDDICADFWRWQYQNPKGYDA